MTDFPQHAAPAAPQVLAFVSQKGGAGKTTLALNIAAYAAQSGRKVTVLDCDPNCSAVVWSDLRSDAAPEVRYCPYLRLDREIEKARTKGTDLILIDTPMGADGGPVAGARHASLVVVPCRQSLFDLAAIRASLDIAALAETPAVAVLNAVPTRAAHWEIEARDMLSRQGVQMLPTAVRNRVAFVRSTRPAGAAGHLVLTEGVEDALAIAGALGAGGRRDIAVAAAISAGRVHRVGLPPGIRRVTLVQDRDLAGENAWVALCREHAGSAVLLDRIVPRAKDANDELLALGPARFRARLASQGLFG